MRVLRKDGNSIHVVATPNDRVRIGDYLIVKDEAESLVLQIFDESYLDVDGVEEEIAREEVLLLSATGLEEDPMDIRSISKLIRDMRVLHCKPRGVIHDGAFSPRIDWIPSRTASKVSKLRATELLDMVAPHSARAIRVGSVDSSNLSISAEAFDGRITIITGRKESGKSHLAKIIVRGLLGHGAYTIVFDLNDEYGSIGLRRDGSRTLQAFKVNVVRPGRELRFGLSSAGLRAVTSLLQHSLDIPGTSLREFVKIWEAMQSRGEVTMKQLGETIQQWRCNELVRDALHSRYFSLVSSGLFTDAEDKFELRSFFKGDEGGVLVISLSGVSPLIRRMAVELILAKLVELLEQRKIPPTFLLAEEAHLYLRETYWEDLITRMRHFGVFTIFVTNQPDAIKPEIYRQVDNIFLYNFSNDADLNLVSQASMVDADTVRAVVRSLPLRTCLTLGHAVSNLPVVTSIDEFDSPSSGVTRRFFKEVEVGVRQRTAKLPSANV